MNPNSPPVTPRRGRATVSARRVGTLIFLAAVLALSLALPGTASSATRGKIVLYNKSFRCGDYSQPLRLKLLKVTMRNRNGDDAVALNRGGNCRGSIGRIEVRTWAADGVKVGPDTHDLVIGGGFIRCFGRARNAHQDAIQVMGGARVRFRRIVTRCGSSNHSSFFVNRAAPGQRMPRRITCSYCNLRGGSTTVHIANARRSGVKNSVVYAGSHTAFRGERRVDVWRANRVIPYRIWHG